MVKMAQNIYFRPYLRFKSIFSKTVDADDDDYYTREWVKMEIDIGLIWNHDHSDADIVDTDDDNDTDIIIICNARVF